MKKKSSPSWLSAYLYYNEPWERLLTEVILPYTQVVLNTGIAASYFFIRYWDKGPHIRLRIQAEPDVIEKILRPNLEEHFLSYFASAPSTRTDPPYPVGIPESYKWHPNNTIQYAVYQAELDRYGGLVGIDLAERQFALSSEVVLQSILDKGKHWSYDDALGTAIKLHLIFLHAVGLNQTDATAFFTFFFENWLPHSFDLNPAKMNGVTYQKEKEKTLAAFTDAFELQKESLVSFHSVLWNALDEGEVFEEKLLNKWTEGNRTIIKSLKESEENNTLTDRTASSFRYEHSSSVYKSQILWEHYADYMHMTNNRLGIHNKDEGYLAFLMLKSMEMMGASETIEKGGEGASSPHFFLP